MGAADNVDVVFDRKLRKELQVLRRELRQAAHGGRGALFLDHRQKLRCKDLRKKDEVAFVVGGNFKVVFALLRELLEAVDMSKLILDNTGSDRRDRHKPL